MVWESLQDAEEDVVVQDVEDVAVRRVGKLHVGDTPSCSCATAWRLPD